MEETRWTSVLTDGPGETVRSIVARVMNAIAITPYAQLDSLALLHQVLLFTYAAREHLSFSANVDVNSRLSLALEAVSADLPLFLHGGLVEVAWIVEHLDRMSRDGISGLAEEANYLAAIDELIFAELDKDVWQGHYDLISGLVGIGVYLLERLPRPSARRYLERVIYHLDRSATATEDEIRVWRTSPAHMSSSERMLCPVGGYNLGVAHGIPGVIRFLSECVANSIRPTKSRALLDEAVKWVLMQVDPFDGSNFPCWITPGRVIKRTRLGWCYGDLGTAASLFQTAEIIGNSPLKMSMLDVLRRCAERVPQRTTNVGICHGCLGVAHVFNRIYHSCGEVVFRTRAIEYYLHGASAFMSFGSADHKWGFLEGNCGSVLALLAGISSIEPAWDRSLLLSDNVSFAIGLSH
jgi:hypothetical protein